jgi:hypothetical protein
MKLKILLSILFAIVTTFTAMHQAEHVKQHTDSSACLVCTINNNIVSGDAVVFLDSVKTVKFEKITQENLLSYSHQKTNSNQSRAPPKIS